MVANTLAFRHKEKKVYLKWLQTLQLFMTGKKSFIRLNHSSALLIEVSSINRAYTKKLFTAVVHSKVSLPLSVTFALVQYLQNSEHKK
jgi:hypothetical protein